MADSVRIVVCGDENTGKSSLITALVKDIFVSGKIQPVLPPITIAAPDNLTTTIVDTSGLIYRFQCPPPRSVKRLTRPGDSSPGSTKYAAEGNTAVKCDLSGLLGSLRSFVFLHGGYRASYCQADLPVLRAMKEYHFSGQ